MARQIPSSPNFKRGGSNDTPPGVVDKKSTPDASLPKRATSEGGHPRPASMTAGEKPETGNNHGPTSTPGLAGT